MQLISHYNWLLTLCDRKPESDNPNYRLSERLRSIGSTTASDILAGLEIAPFLFNFQSRTILGEENVTGNSEQIFEGLAAYKMVGTTSRLPQLLEAMTGDTVVGSIPTENSISYQFDKALFNDPEIQQYLRVNNSQDEILYELLR
jgi:hypothetical protein